MRTRSLSGVALFTLFSIPALAQEPPAAPAPNRSAMGDFGSAGQIAISVDLPFTAGAPQLSIIHESRSNGGGSQTAISIAPAADYFIIPNLSIGGIIGVATGTTFVDAGVVTISGDTTTFIIGPRIGYVLRLTDQLSFWPRLGIEYLHESISTGGNDVSGSKVPLIVDAPVLWHPAPHFFVGAGLLFSTDLSSSVSSGNLSMDASKTTRIGLEAMIGGYFGGT